jgi:hypothetical protein
MRDGVVDGLLFTWVDDLLALSGSTSATDILNEIGKHIHINLKGIPNHFIGQDLLIADRSITLSQHLYAQSLDVESVDKPIQHPLPLNILKEEDTSPLLSKEDTTMYTSLLGKFAYLIHTRPDLAYTYSFLGTYSARPTEKAYRLLYRACQYAKQTASRSIVYKVCHTVDFVLDALCDASMGSHNHDAQSGYIFTLNGAPILWRSIVQQRAHHSSTASECDSMHNCLDRLILCIYFIKQLHVNVSSTLHSDSLDLIKLLNADHPRPTARHMLIELRQMQAKLVMNDSSVKRLVQPLLSIHDCLHYFPNNSIKLVHIAGNINPSDCLTKPADLHPLVSRYMSTLHYK